MRTERMIISSAAREHLRDLYPPEGRLPSLISDARENPLVRRSVSEGDILVKSPTFPYAEHHMLVIPDRSDQGSTPSVLQVPEALLAKTFATVGEIAEHYANNPTILEINTGWNHSPHEDRKHVATQVNTLHFHVTGYTREDLDRTVSVADIKSRPELYTKEKEPLAGLIANVLQHEVFADLEASSEFNERFKKVGDGSRITYEIVNGVKEFSRPELAKTVQDIHAKAAAAYNELASCFFEKDLGQFAQTAENGNRYVLLSQEERTAKIDSYITGREYLSPIQKRTLKYMASQAVTMETMHEDLQAKKGQEPLTEDEKYDRNPMMAIKGFAYAAVMTGVRQDDGHVTWRLGFDPVVFAPRDVIQASRGTFAHFERLPNAVMSDEAQMRMREDENVLVQKMQSGRV